MDHIDHQILQALGANGRATTAQISAQVHLSVPAVAERIRKLEQSGAIEYYTAKVNRTAVGQKLLSFVSVQIDRTEHVEDFRNAVLALDTVLECHHMAGPYDYLLKVLVADTAELEVFLSRELKAIPGVRATNTAIVLSTLRERLNRP